VRLGLGARPLNSGVMWLRRLPLGFATIALALVGASLAACVGSSANPQAPYKTCISGNGDPRGWAFLAKAPLDDRAATSVLGQRNEPDRALEKGVRVYWFQNGNGEYARCTFKPEKGVPDSCSSDLRKWHSTSSGWKVDDDFSVTSCASKIPR
jgi:hypothetical protein